ncbi:MAG: BAX inhibitor (BI)-1/YccA family protein, partial [Gammaproteobacteria bacterium]|nr:BAX inhibitor (BI)-1/YccA family protein [Gammaproteobacteria bacterium]
MGATAAIFLGVSAYARSERAVDMLRYSTFLTVGILTAFALGLGAIFFDLPALSLAVSGMFILL